MTGKVWGRAAKPGSEKTIPSGAASELRDARWDALRTQRGLSAVIGFSLAVIFVGPLIVWFIDDGWGIIPLAFVATILLSWSLLQLAVRRVPDSSDAALDERLIAIRNRIYLSAYRALGLVMGLIVVVLLGWSIVEIRAGTLSLALDLTWPQVNAALWFVMALLMLFPSLTLALAIVQRKVKL